MYNYTSFFKSIWTLAYSAFVSNSLAVGSDVEIFNFPFEFFLCLYTNTPRITDTVTASMVVNARGTARNTAILVS